MPAAAPPGAKVGDGQPRSHGKLSTATKAASEEAERVKAFVAQAGYRAYFSLAEKKYAGSALLVKRLSPLPRCRRAAACMPPGSMSSRPSTRTMTAR